MIKVEVINEDFTLERFGELKNIVRKNKEEKGKLFKGDVFECSEELCDYLSGNNPLKKAVVKIIEIKPKKEIKEEEAIVEVIFDKEKGTRKIEEIVENSETPEEAIKKVQENINEILEVKPKSTKKKKSSKK